MIYDLIKVADRLEYNLYSYASERLLNALKAKYPELQEQLNRFKNKNKYIVWLANRFGEKPTKEDHPITDCIDILFDYLRKEDGLAQKYRTSQEFRDLVKELTEGKTYKDLKVIENISSDEMRAILTATEKKEEVVPTAANVDISGDKIGKVGEWNIWLPSSRDKSVHIAQFETDDAGNKKPKTTWCTARTDASNLFYNYIGSASGGKSMLFYIIKDDPKGAEDYLSVGFVYGKPVLPCKKFGVSIDRDQEGLTVERLQNIWGENYQVIMDMMQKKCDELGGVSPAYPIIKAATTDLNKFKKLIKGNSKKEAEELIVNLLKYFTFDPSIINYLIKTDSGEKVKKQIIEITDDESRLKILIEDENHEVRSLAKVKIAKTTLDENILNALKEDESANISVAAEKRIQTIRTVESGDDQDKLDLIYDLDPKDPIFNKILSDKSAVIRRVLAEFFVEKKHLFKEENRNYILTKLVTDEDEHIRKFIYKRYAFYPFISFAVAKNVNEHLDQRSDALHIVLNTYNYNKDVDKSLYENFFKELSKDPNENIRFIIVNDPHVGKNENIIKEFVNDNSFRVRQYIIYYNLENENIIKEFVNDPSEEIRKSIVGMSKNPNILKLFYKDESFDIRRKIIDYNTKNDDILKEFVNDPSEEIRKSIAYSIKDKDALRILSKDPEYSVRREVLYNDNTDKDALIELYKSTDFSAFEKDSIYYKLRNMGVDVEKLSSQANLFNKINVFYKLASSNYYTSI